MSWREKGGPMDRFIQFELRLADSRLLDNPYRETALFSRLADHLCKQTFDGNKPRRVGVSGCAITPKMYFTFCDDVVPPINPEGLNRNIRNYIENTQVEEFGFRWDKKEPDVLVVYNNSKSKP
ncbi:hypothetical protein [Fusibacter sp. JL216-2]|uniref:hypothetical protein n=1 Tax=Fusibacter sp. JL216-2 TaxID=3071453 RepID=UPI003D341C9B